VGGWFVSGRLSPTWSIDQLVDALELTGGRIEAQGAVLEKLLDLAGASPGRAADAVALWVDGAEPIEIAMSADRLYELLVQLVANEASSARARQTAHRLVARNLPQFVDLATPA